MTPHEVLEGLATSTVAHVWDLVCNIPGGTNDDRCGIATAVMGEILARTLVQPEAEMVAAITNMRLADHRLTWRVVPLAS